MRYLAVICAFFAGLACGVLGSILVARHATDVASVEPGSEAISILEEEVMSVVFRTDKMTFTAQRSKPKAPFAVQITYADERPAHLLRQSVRTTQARAHLP